MRRLNDVTTTLLDTLAILAVAAGIVFAVHPQLGWGAALMLAGVALGAMSMAVQVAHRDRPPVHPKAAPRRAAPPGPEDPGPVHISGG